MEGLTLDLVFVDTLLRFPGELRAPINNQTAALSLSLVRCSTWNQINHLETGPAELRTVLQRTLLSRVIQSRSQDTISRGSGEVSQPRERRESGARLLLLLRIMGAKYKWQTSITQGFVQEWNSRVVRINLSTVAGVAPDRSLGINTFQGGWGTE